MHETRNDCSFVDTPPKNNPHPTIVIGPGKPKVRKPRQPKQKKD